MFSLLLFAAWTIESLLNFPQVDDPQMRPGGEMYAYVQQGNVLLSPLENGAPRQVHSCRLPRWSPDSRRLAFLARQDGTDQVFLFDVASGAIRQFTHSQSGAGSYAWAPDGRAIAFLATDPGPAPDPQVSGQYSRYSRLYWQAIDSPVARRVTGGAAHVASFVMKSNPAIPPHLLNISLALQALHMTFRGQFFCR